MYLGQRACSSHLCGSPAFWVMDGLSKKTRPNMFTLHLLILTLTHILPCHWNLFSIFSIMISKFSTRSLPLNFYISSIKFLHRPFVGIVTMVMWPAIANLRLSLYLSLSCQRRFAIDTWISNICEGHFESNNVIVIFLLSYNSFDSVQSFLY